MDKHDLELALGLFYFLSYYFFFLRQNHAQGKESYYYTVQRPLYLIV